MLLIIVSLKFDFQDKRLVMKIQYSFKDSSISRQISPINRIDMTISTSAELKDFLLNEKFKHPLCFKNTRQDSIQFWKMLFTEDSYNNMRHNILDKNSVEKENKDPNVERSDNHSVVKSCLVKSFSRTDSGQLGKKPRTGVVDNRSEGRELPTSDLPGSLVPSPLTSDELGSGLTIAPMTNTVETTTVVMREDEFVPLRAGSYLEQEAVMESKSTSSVVLVNSDSDEEGNIDVNNMNDMNEKAMDDVLSIEPIKVACNVVTTCQPQPFRVYYEELLQQGITTFLSQRYGELINEEIFGFNLVEALLNKDQNAITVEVLVGEYLLIQAQTFLEIIKKKGWIEFFIGFNSMIRKKTSSVLKAVFVFNKLKISKEHTGNISSSHIQVVNNGKEYKGLKSRFLHDGWRTDEENLTILRSIMDEEEKTIKEAKITIGTVIYYTSNANNDFHYDLQNTLLLLGSMETDDVRH